MDAVSYKDLIVWQLAMDFVAEIYRLTGSFPRDEMYGMTSQIRRAAVSIPANIAEGNGRASRRDYAHFVSIALASAREIETLLLISRGLGFISSGHAEELDSKLDEIARMLFSMHRKLATPVVGTN
ncbi:MAG: four helix bundle protein [Planctomycetales bacterium]|nr:four helix bundle protein [bacterium]UNM09769.1 MAG: four helix bundle protein [Planctomycetales bacterium]